MYLHTKKFERGSGGEEMQYYFCVYEKNGQKNHQSGGVRAGPLSLSSIYVFGQYIRKTIIDLQKKNYKA